MAKIVILNEQPEICKRLGERLKRDGHEVRLAHAADVAIDLGYLFQPDVLIAFLELSGEYSCLEVAEAVRFSQKTVKTILVTADDLNLNSSASNVFETIINPISVNEIAGIVERANVESHLLN